MEIIARRAFSPTYILFDTAFLIFFLMLLIWKRKYITASVGIIMGIVYMAVDFGIFHLLLGTRSIEGGSLFWTLLWMSMSYGFTNFVWIWLWLEKDENLFEWSLLILLWWFVCPLLASSSEPSIVIQRTTGAYHGYMALILLAGYLGAIIYNLRQGDRRYRIDILWMLRSERSIYVLFKRDLSMGLGISDIVFGLVLGDCDHIIYQLPLFFRAELFDPFDQFYQNILHQIFRRPCIGHDPKYLVIDQTAVAIIEGRHKRSITVIFYR